MNNTWSVFIEPRADREGYTATIPELPGFSVAGITREIVMQEAVLRAPRYAELLAAEDLAWRTANPKEAAQRDAESVRAAQSILGVFSRCPSPFLDILQNQIWTNKP